MVRLSGFIAKAPLLIAFLIISRVGTAADKGPGVGTPIESVPTIGIQHFLRVPLIDQGTDFSCGVSAMQSVLMYYDVLQNYYESEIISDLKVDPDSGILVKQIRKFAQDQGFKVQVIKNMSLDFLLNELRAGRPVIVIIQAWPDKPGPWRTMVDEGHYVVVNGFDANNIYMMDPQVVGNYGYIPIREFLDRWHLEDDEFGEYERIEHLGIVISKSGKPNFKSDIAVRVH